MCALRAGIAIIVRGAVITRSRIILIRGRIRILRIGV
jgi:hypothetical protein